MMQRGKENWNELPEEESKFDSLDIQQLEEFLANPVFEALLDTLEKRRELIRTEMETGISSGNKILTQDDFRERIGECSSIRYIMNVIPKILELKIEQRDLELRQK